MRRPPAVNRNQGLGRGRESAARARSYHRVASIAARLGSTDTLPPTNEQPPNSTARAHERRRE